MIIAIAFIFDFLNGVNDAADAVTMVISTKVLRPRQAVLWAAFFNFVGAFGFGTAVAITIGNGIVDPNFIEPVMALAALLGSIAWTNTATYFWIPISVSHALIGGFIGAGLVFGETGALILGEKLCLIIAFIAITPIAAMGIAQYFHAPGHEGYEKDEVKRSGQVLQMIPAVLRRGIQIRPRKQRCPEDDGYNLHSSHKRRLFRQWVAICSDMGDIRLPWGNCHGDHHRGL